MLKMVSGKMPLGKKPPGKKNPKKCPRKYAPQENAPPRKNAPPQENCPQEKLFNLGKFNRFTSLFVAVDIILQLLIFKLFIVTGFRGVSRTPATSIMDLLVTLVNSIN